MFRRKRIRKKTPEFGLTPNVLREALSRGSRDLEDKEISNLAVHSLSVANYSLGLKASSAPYNVHKDVMIRYIKEVFKISPREYGPAMQKVISEGPHYKPVLKYLVKNGSNLITKGDGSCCPYFRLQIPGLPEQTFTSPCFQNDVNPCWNIMITLTIEPGLVNSYQNIICELWDKDHFSFSRLFGILFSNKSFFGFLQAIADFCLYFLYFCLPGNFDDRIGIVSISLNQIPSTEWHISSNIIDAFGDNCGSINLALSWSASQNRKSVRYYAVLVRHLEILNYLIRWHALDLAAEVESVQNFPGLFYTPAISLINQSRLQSNIDSDEHNILVHSVACNLLSYQYQRTEAAERMRLILLSFIASLEPPKTSTHFTGSVREVFCHVLNEKIENLLRNFLMMINEIRNNAINKKTTEFALFLKVFDRYDKAFVISSYRKRLNDPTVQFLISHIQDNLSFLKSWPKLVDDLELLNDITCKNWSQSLGAILGTEGLRIVRRIFSSEARGQLSQIIKSWQSDRSKYNSALLDAYFLVQRLDKVLFRNLVTRADPVTNYIVYKEKIFEGAKKRKGKWIIQDNKSPKASRAKPVSGGTESVRNVKSCPELLPTSVTKFVDVAVTQLKTKPEKRIVATMELGLSEKFEFKDKSQEVSGLMKVFPAHIELKWFSDQEAKIQKFIDNFIANDIVESETVGDAAKKSGEVYYEILSESMYFYADCYCWDERTFETALTLFSNCVLYFYSNFYRELKKRARRGNDSEWIVFGLNFLSLLRDRYLRRNFIECFTNMPAEDVWNWILSYLDLRPLDILESPSETSIFVRKIESLGFPPTPKAVALACIRIDSICNELSLSEGVLIDVLINKQLKAAKRLIQNEIKGKVFAAIDEQYMENIRERFSTLLSQTVDVLEVDDAKATFIIGLRHNLVRFSKSRINDVSRLTNDDDKKSPRRVRMELIRASVIAEKMIEVLVSRLYELELIDYYLKEKIEDSLENPSQGSYETDGKSTLATTVDTKSSARRTNSVTRTTSGESLLLDPKNSSKLPPNFDTTEGNQSDHSLLSKRIILASPETPKSSEIEFMVLKKMLSKSDGLVGQTDNERPWTPEHPVQVSRPSSLRIARQKSTETSSTLGLVGDVEISGQIDELTTALDESNSLELENREAKLMRSERKSSTAESRQSL